MKLRGHIYSQGPKDEKGVRHGAPWGVVVELGEQEAQVCPTCVDGRGAHKRMWVKDRPLTACRKCKGPLDDVKVRRQFNRNGIATKREAEAILEEQLGQRKAGTYVEPSTQTVKEFLEGRWLPDTKASRRPSTHSSYEHHVEAYIVPELGSLLLRNLDAGHINAMYAKLAAPGGGRRGKGLSAATQVHIHHTLRRALRDALGWRLVSHNAAAAANPPATGELTMPMMVWTREQVSTFLGHVDADRLQAMWRTFAMTGMRRSEVCGLQWQHVDFKHSAIRVRQAAVVVDSKVVLGPPKTKAGRRTVSIGKGTLDALVAWYVAQAEELRMLEAAQTPETFVFTDRKGDPVHPERVTEAFNEHQATLRAEILKRHEEAGAEGDAPVLPTLRLHGIRHSHATQLHLDGVPPAVAAKRLGHSVLTYLEVYVEPNEMPEAMRDAATDFEALQDAAR